MCSRSPASFPRFFPIIAPQLFDNWPWVNNQIFKFIRIHKNVTYTNNIFEKTVDTQLSVPASGGVGFPKNEAVTMNNNFETSKIRFSVF